MASTALPNNWSVQAIPIAFLYGILPHSYYLIRLMQATKGEISNAMPRTNLDAWKTELPADVWNHLARVRGAHLNAMEVFPLFAAAVVAGNFAKLSAEDMNSMCLSFFAARTVYMSLYMGIKHDILAYPRTGVYAWSISIPIMCLWKAGQMLSQN